MTYLNVVTRKTWHYIL